MICPDCVLDMIPDPKLSHVWYCVQCKTTCRKVLHRQSVIEHLAMLNQLSVNEQRPHIQKALADRITKLEDYMNSCQDITVGDIEEWSSKESTDDHDVFDKQQEDPTVRLI